MSSYDRAAAEAALSEFRKKRRSITPTSVAKACEALGFTIDKNRGKGSHWLAVRSKTRPITIPTGNKNLGLKTATGILRRLEETFDDDAS
jgi:predicted RNA binding protein YcfA (HicA-like mRNA interferase family)